MSSSSRVTRSEKCLRNSRCVVETTSLTPLISRNLTSLRVVSVPARLESRKIVSSLVSKSGHCGLFVKEFENKGSVHWLRQGDKEPGEEFLKRAYQQAADEGTPGLAFSASGSLGIRSPAGMAPSTFRFSGFRRGTLRSQLVSFFDCVRLARHRGGLGFGAKRLHDDVGRSSSSQSCAAGLPGVT